MTADQVRALALRARQLAVSPLAGKATAKAKRKAKAKAKAKAKPKAGRRSRGDRSSEMRRQKAKRDTERIQRVRARDLIEQNHPHTPLPTPPHCHVANFGSLRMMCCKMSSAS